ncbi:NAD(P)/FAD-dependent oxidoreductase [Rhodoligotrophos defluvii]|uniref:FAD/NAD(P)-dependent oxidoreductase n=1 Tax=Rhodoligotrophos defluvii TaxID=2561934 RepID=UPI0010C9925A|nr:FAD/NAD(P)-binding oxidoreductase [Rhodoligotrophos defluvii]
MADPRIVIVGAGPAGTRAAEALVAAGLRPTVIDEGRYSGGQIYRRQPPNFTRRPEALYGTEAAKARAIHSAFDQLAGRIDYRPETLAWAVKDNTLHIQKNMRIEALDYDALLIASGATDRVIPLPGWTFPGCYSLGAAQITLKMQACAIGSRVVFLGTGPLLYLVAWQYLKAGCAPLAVLDTSRMADHLAGLPLMASRPEQLLKGARLVSGLRRAGVAIWRGILPREVLGDPDRGVAGIRFTDANGQDRQIDCNAIGMGYHLRAESQLADLAGCEFAFDPLLRQWLPHVDDAGRSSVANVYLAGDGVRILGADAAETSGRLAAMALLTDFGRAQPRFAMDRLRRLMQRHKRFAQGIAKAFPWPWQQMATMPRTTVVCRCEAITVDELCSAVETCQAPEVNRAKAFSRVGMGRCQGRFCGQASQEIVAFAQQASVESSGRLRGQAPVKPLPIGVCEEVGHG